MDAPAVSVIIACHRSGPGLRRQVDALLHQQDAPPAQILLCDNGGTPWLEQWVLEHPESPERLVRVPADAMPGAAYARNCGIRVAAADLIAVCDDDDLVHPLWLRRAVEALAHHRVVSGGVVSVPRCRMDSSDTPELRQLLLDGITELPARPVGPGAIAPALLGGNFAARRDVLLEVGGFDAVFAGGGEDNDLALRLQRRGIQIQDVSGMGILYSRPDSLLACLRTSRRNGRALSHVRAVHGGDLPISFLEGSVLTALLRPLGAAAGMALGRRPKDFPAVLDRMAILLGILEGDVRHRLLRRGLRSQVGAGLDSPDAERAPE